MVDAVAVLLPVGASGPARLQLRTAFENMLTVKYLTQRDATSRAYDFLAAQAQAEIGKVWKVATKHPDLAPPDSVAEHLTTLQRRLMRRGWREANERLLEIATRRFEKDGRFAPPELGPACHGRHDARGGPASGRHD
jgi:hypothetical protein